MTSRQVLVTTAGFTQADSVMPVVRCRLAESGMSTRAFVPLNTSALPYLPVGVHVAFWMLPVLPWPDRSATVVPPPSLKAYAATNAAVLCTVTATGGDVAVLPAASLTTAVSVWAPSTVAVEFQEVL